MPTADDMKWFKQQFSAQITPALAGTPFDVDMLVAIASQETGEVWPILRTKGLPIEKILALCVGDTIDQNGGRDAFPRTKAQLVAAPNGQAMFDIARQALVDMAAFIPSYRRAASLPNKFCHGYGMFQRDIQFFKDDPNYFLQRRYENFSDTLSQCLDELRKGLKRLGLQSRTHITDVEFAHVAIVYNTGHFDPARGLNQGFKDDSGKFYGELIFDFVTLSRTVDAAPAPALAAGPYVVVARGGLKLRGGPGTSFEAQETLALGTELNVVAVSSVDPSWVSVDLQGDGILDGFVFASFLAPAGSHVDLGEHAPEPD